MTDSPITSFGIVRTQEPERLLSPRSQSMDSLHLIETKSFKMATSDKVSTFVSSVSSSKSIEDDLLGESFYSMDILSDVKAEELASGPLLIRTMMIIGGTGNVGTALIKKYYKKHVKSKDGICLYNRIICISRSEQKQIKLREKYPDIEFILGDIKEADFLTKTIKLTSPSVIIIASGMKDLYTCDKNIEQCMMINYTGVKNVISAVFDNIDTTKNHRLLDLFSVVLISSDKACLPSTSFGLSKALAERLIHDAADKAFKIKLGTRFSIIRAPDVINCKNGKLAKIKEASITSEVKSLSISGKHVTCFIMFIEQLSTLIHTGIEYLNSGETLIPILQSMDIYDFTKEYSKKYNKPILLKYLPGERKNEILIESVEMSRSEKRKIGNLFFYVIHSPLSVPLLTPLVIDNGRIMKTVYEDYKSDIDPKTVGYFGEDLLKYV